MAEQFPFGRRQFRFELLPLLDLALASKPRPRIVCSVRDILVTKNTPAKHQQTVDYIDAYFDTVIVHGDPAFVPFETTFPLAYAFAGKIHYSGYVAPPENPNTEDCVDTGRDEVIVAAGGGAVGADLMICVARAKAQSSLSHLTWRFLIGPNLPSSIVSAIADLNDPGILIEPNRSDYGALLKNCTLSISQGGYNTMMDIIRAGCAAIVVPFGSGDEDEQSRRAAILHNHGYVTMIAETALSLDLLSAGINQAISRSHSKYSPFSLEGATRTAGIITNKR